MLNPPLHFLFRNISIISIVSPIFIQPSVFIIVLFYFTHLSYSFYLPLPLYKLSCIHIQNSKSYKKESYNYSPLSSVLASDRLFYSHFSTFSLGFLSPAVPEITQHYFHLHSRRFTKGFIQFHLFPVQIHPSHHFSVLCSYLVIFPPASHQFPTQLLPDMIPRFR